MRITDHSFPLLLGLTPGPLWLVPFGRTGSFVGRQEELKRLEAKFIQTASFQKVAILGLGGIGKSRLALELTYRLIAQRQTLSVFWVRASDPLVFEKDLFEIGKTLEIPGIDDENADVKNLVKQRLSRISTGEWLLILDGADDENLWTGASERQRDQMSLVKDLPNSPRGSILITSRSRRITTYLAGKETIELREMAKDEAVEILRDQLVEPEILANLDATFALLEQLTFLPLAIVQAAAYMNMNDITIQMYLHLLADTEENVIYLLSEDFEADGRDNSAKNPVATTWLVSFEQIRRDHPLAAEYLSFMSCLNQKNIPQFLLPEAPSNKKMIDAIGTLVGYGFVQRRYDVFASEPLYDMHRLVYLAARNWLRLQHVLLEWTEVSLTRVNERFPTPEYGNKEIWTVLMPHAQALLSSDMISDVDGRYELLEKVGLCLEIEGRYAQAVAVHSSIVSWREKTHGTRDEGTLWAYTHLGEALRLQGDWGHAERYMLQAFQGQRDVLGAAHPTTLSSMTNLASTYRDQGRLTEAEELEVQVLETRRIVLGAEHPSTLISMGNLAMTYWNQGRWTEAEELEVQVLETRKRVLGAEHPATLVSIASLASLYSNQGRWAEAEGLELAVVETSKRVMGAEHPSTLTSMSNLASTYRNQGRWTEAEELEVQVLETRKRVLGAEHPATLVSITNLASTYSNQGRSAEAENLELAVVETSKRVMGAEHPSTLTSMSNLASTYRNQRRWTEAEELEVQVLEIRKRVLGAEHPSTLTSMGNLASTYWNQGRWIEAEDLGLQTMQECKKTMGDAHPYTLLCMSLLCRVWMARGAYLSAERLLLDVLQMQQDILPADHPDILESTRMLSSVLSQSSINWTNVPDQQRMSSQYNAILRNAARAGHEKLIASLLDSRIDAEAMGDVYSTALYNAAERGHENIVRLLLEKGADANYKGEQQKSALYVASRAGGEAVARLLLENGADADLPCGSHGTALHAACATGHGSIVRLLLEKGADLHAQCERHGSPLHAACSGGHEAVVMLLLTKGVDANIHSIPHGTPLQTAAANKHQKLTRILVDRIAWYPSAQNHETNDMDDLDDLQSSASTLSLFDEPTGFSENSGGTNSASSITSIDARAPEEVYDLLLTGVLLHPTLKQLSEKILEIKGKSFFSRRFERSIKQFCRNLSTESSNLLQKRATQILRRRYRYFTYRATLLLSQITSQTSDTLLANLPAREPNVVAKVEKYLQAFNINTVSDQGERIPPIRAHADQEPPFQGEEQPYRQGKLTEGVINADSDDTDNESSEDEGGPDGEVNASSLHLIMETISWFVESVAFRNFIHDLTREFSPPMDYVDKVLRFALPPSSNSITTFHLQWDLVDYIQTQLDNIQQLRTVLTLSGDASNAEASTCLDYCETVWPIDGRALVDALQNAISHTNHCKLG
jgi:hypothetical protein